MVRKGKEPSKLGIMGLSDAQARNDVREMSDGWIKASDFIIGIDDALEERETIGSDWAARTRLTTTDLDNWAKGELQQIFGVATFRRAIVSGGNFSDSDRIFVQRAIAYINSLDPLNNYDVYKAQVTALAGFIDNMYRKGLSAYDMKFDPETLDKWAADLEAEGEPDAASRIREQAESGRLFMDRFGIDYKKGKDFDPEAVAAARRILWDSLPADQKKDIGTSAPK
jgi:hypothetical protein